MPKIKSEYAYVKAYIEGYAKPFMVVSSARGSKKNVAREFGGHRKGAPIIRVKIMPVK